jgi:hypothetical protein
MANVKKQTNPTNSPAAWFCVLEIARKRGDFEQAAQATRELKRLGVDVKYRVVRESHRQDQDGGCDA